jgi:hypothetical protein
VPPALRRPGCDQGVWPDLRPGRLYCQSRRDPLRRAQVQQHVDQGVLVGDRPLVAQFRALDAQIQRLTVDAFTDGALVEDRQVLLARAVKLPADARTRPGREVGLATTVGHVRIRNRAGGAGHSRVVQRAAEAFFLVWFQPAAAGVGELQLHRQAGGTERSAIGGEGAGRLVRLVNARHGGKAVRVECAVDVMGVEGGIKGAVTRMAPESRFGLLHQGPEVADVALVEGPGAFGQHHFTEVGQNGGADPGGVAPVVLGIAAFLRGADAVGGRGRRRRGCLGVGTGVAAGLDAKLAVAVAPRLAGGVKALFDVLFRVVLFDPGEDVLGVDGDHLAEGGGQIGRQLRANELDAAGEQELQGRIVQFAEHARQLAARWQTGVDIEAVSGVRIGLEAKAEQPDQGRVLAEVATQGAHGRFLLMQLDQEGGDERRTGGGYRSGPGAVGGPLGKVCPVEIAEHGAIRLGHRAGRNEGRQRQIGVRKRQRSIRCERIRRRRLRRGGWAPAEERRKPVEERRHMRYHNHVSDSGGCGMW